MRINRTDLMIQSRLEIHNFIMQKMIQAGMQPEAASKKAFDAIMTDKETIKTVKDCFNAKIKKMQERQAERIKARQA